MSIKYLRITGTGDGWVSVLVRDDSGLRELLGQLRAEIQPHRYTVFFPDGIEITEVIMEEDAGGDRLAGQGLRAILQAYLRLGDLPNLQVCRSSDRSE